MYVSQRVNELEKVTAIIIEILVYLVNPSGEIDKKLAKTMILDLEEIIRRR